MACFNVWPWNHTFGMPGMESLFFLHNASMNFQLSIVQHPDALVELNRDKKYSFEFSIDSRACY